MTQEDFYEFLVDAAESAASACEPGAMVYLVMSAQEWVSIMSAMQRAGFHWSSTIIWSKGNLCAFAQVDPLRRAWDKQSPGLFDNPQHAI